MIKLHWRTLVYLLENNFFLSVFSFIVSICQCLWDKHHLLHSICLLRTKKGICSRLDLGNNTNFHFLFLWTRNISILNYFSHTSVFGFRPKTIKCHFIRSFFPWLIINSAQGAKKVYRVGTNQGTKSALNSCSCCLGSNLCGPQDSSTLPCQGSSNLRRSNRCLEDDPRVACFIW